MFEYIEKVAALFEKIQSTQSEVLMKASHWIAETIIEDTIIHTFGTGHSHMVGMEAFCRASGLGNVNAILDDAALLTGGARKGAMLERLGGVADIIWDNYKIERKDLLIIISNSGRNALPIEMALRAKREAVKTICITSMAQATVFESRHRSGKRLFEIADLVIDNCVPPGDGMLNIAQYLAGPASTLAGCLVINTIISEGMKQAIKVVPELPVYQSQNMDGSNNDKLHQRYNGRVRHL